jgi:hypothetical protein
VRFAATPAEFVVEPTESVSLITIALRRGLAAPQTSDVQVPFGFPNSTPAPHDVKPRGIATG